MDFLEAVEKYAGLAVDDTPLYGINGVFWWIRPVSWVGSKIGLFWDKPNKLWKVVPSATGGMVAQLPAINLLMGEWEVVDSEKVLKGL